MFIKCIISSSTTQICLATLFNRIRKLKSITSPLLRLCKDIFNESVFSPWSMNKSHHFFQEGSYEIVNFHVRKERITKEAQGVPRKALQHTAGLLHFLFGADLQQSRARSGAQAGLLQQLIQRQRPSARSSLGN